MTLHFVKYQATGNDFVILDNRQLLIKFSAEQIQRICDRRFGVGADGLMLIEPDPKLDFKLQYYNSDGSQSLCGNGSRAAVSFASTLGWGSGKFSFNAYDGPHDAELMSSGEVRLRMNDVSEVKEISENEFFIHTGSPHHIMVVKSLDDFPVFEEGRKVRYSSDYQPSGTNVNFLQRINDNTIYVRTYERGVENETLSCGTGVTAAALAASYMGYSSPVKIRTRGGELLVEFERTTEQSAIFGNIFLSGPAKMVFKGHLEL